MNWKMKALIQKTLQYFPGGEEIHFFLQRLGGGLRNIDKECAGKINDFTIMLSHLSEEGVYIEGSDIMEIGTGWYPTFPICLYILGAKKVYSFDLNPHMNAELTNVCLGIVRNNLPIIFQYSNNQDKVQSRLDELSMNFKNDKNIYNSSNGVIECRAPADASMTGFDDNSIDLIFSNSVFEHIPENHLRAIMNESQRILKNNGHCFHSVNCGDHYAYIDKKINQLNYLRYSPKQWEKWNNKFLYQNRLRAKDFVNMTKEAGFEIVLNTSAVQDYRLEQLSEIPVHEYFSQYTNEELSLTTVDILGKK